jgi:hypothetical protein
MGLGSGKKALENSTRKGIILLKQSQPFGKEQNQNSVYPVFTFQLEYEESVFN